MGLIIKPKFHWFEPRQFTREYYRKNPRPWLKPVYIAGCVCLFAIIMLSWWINGQDPAKPSISIWLTIPISISAALLVFYAVPWLIMQIPREVTLSEEGLYLCNTKETLLKWEQISQYQIIERSRISILKFQTHSDNIVMEYGISRSISIDQLDQFLLEVGLSKAEIPPAP